MRALLRLGAAVALGAALGAAGCSLAGPSVKRTGPNTETVTVRECDWESDSRYLIRGVCPNSPILPYSRCRTTPPAAWLLGFPVVFDLVLSPIAYMTARECRVVNTYTRWVEDSKSVAARKRREAEEARKREEFEAARRRESSEKERAAAAEREKAAAEARRLAEALEREFPPLEEFPKTAAAPRPKDFALVVGVEGYRSIPKADYAENDAKRMRAYLEALGVPPQNIILLAGQSASRADLAKYLEEWLPANATPESRVYFYYSGHGAPDPQSGAAYLVPWDGDPAFPKSTAYPLAKVYEALDALPAKESVAMLDACFSGSGGRSVLAPGARPLVSVREDAPPSSGKVSVLAAAGPDQIAGGLELRRHGLFSYYLMRGLSGAADADGNKSVTLGELRDYLGAQVPVAARRANRDQTPRVSGEPSLVLY